MLLRNPPDPLGFIEPCAPVLYEVAPAGPDLLHEIKHDGWRIIARKDGDRVRLWSRNGRDWTADFPGIVTAIAHLPNDRLVLDGEAAGHAPDGLPDFHALQSPEGRAGAILYAFDLLVLDGQDLRPEPLDRRRDLLAETLYDPLGGLALSEAVEGEGATIFRHACALNLEGIVSKRRSARYRSGRDHAWRKIKCPGYRRRDGSTAAEREELELAMRLCCYWAKWRKMRSFWPGECLHRRDRFARLRPQHLKLARTAGAITATTTGLA